MKRVKPFPAPAGLFHISFYRFAQVDDTAALAAWLKDIASAQTLTGTLLLASEGVNGMLAGFAPQLDAFQAAMAKDSRFANIYFKRTPCVTTPFHKLKVTVKSEIVPLGVGDVDASKSENELEPAAWRELLAQDDVVVIDNRNSFEYRLGRFKGAQDPQMQNFRDFAAYMQANLPQWKAEGKRVAMYCTGGIRCEKTSAWLADPAVGLGVPVYQLKGGIIGYFEHMADAERDWQGECFVFDNRVALDTQLRETPTTVEDVYQDEPEGDYKLARAQALQNGPEKV